MRDGRFWVGLPWHWGYRGVSTGPIANDLVAISEEPNVEDHGSQGARLQNRPMVTAFLTDTLCIGCKACEWPARMEQCRRRLHVHRLLVDNTAGLGHSTWRHVKFVERMFDGAAGEPGIPDNAFRWDFSSDVCKHRDTPGASGVSTGSIVRTEFGGVFIQPDVCNGCGYCVVTCPFGVVDRRR